MHFNALCPCRQNVKATKIIGFYSCALLKMTMLLPAHNHAMRNGYRVQLWARLTDLENSQTTYNYCCQSCADPYPRGPWMLRFTGGGVPPGPLSLIILQISGVDINMDPQVETADKKHTPTAGSGGCSITQDREEVVEQPSYDPYMLKTHKDPRVNVNNITKISLQCTIKPG